jgi:hypothetical protein
MNDSMAFVALSDAEGAEIVGGGPIGLIAGIIIAHLVNNFSDFAAGVSAGFAAATR